MLRETNSRSPISRKFRCVCEVGEQAQLRGCERGTAAGSAPYARGDNVAELRHFFDEDAEIGAVEQDVVDLAQ